MNNNNNNQNQNQNNNQNQNENEKNKSNKMAEAETKSASPILSVGITWFVATVILRLNMLRPSNIFLVAVLSFVVYQIVKSKFPPKKVEIMMEPEKPEVKEEPKREEIKKDKKTPKNPELEELNTRIFLYLTEVNLLNEAIKDPFISGELYEIENTLKRIQTQINDDARPDNTKRINQLSDFFDYYMPTTIKILNSYRRIEKQNLTGENATETKKRVEESLPFVRKAFQKELDNMFSEEMLDITTDIDVLESVLSKEGLIDKNNINSVRDIKDDIKNDFFN